MSTKNTSDGPVDAKTTLVLLHGFPFDGRIWREQLKGLGGAVRVETPDLPGFGDAELIPAVADPSMDAYADAIAAWARSHSLDDIVLAGHSMGGYIAFAFARKYPKMLRALILICTRPGADTEAGREGRFKLAADVEERGPQAVVDGMLGKLFAPSDDEAEVEKTRKIMLSQSKEGIVAALHAMASRPDSTLDLKSIDVPVLIVTGAEDAIIPAAEAPAMLEQIPSAKHVEIEGAGHMPMMEAPDSFNRALRGFLAKLDK